MPVLSVSPDILLRLFLAALLGGAIGLERVWSGHPAGLRTNMMIAISSCLFTILSTTGFPQSLSADPTRIASQIVVGVGFLGAGIVLHNHQHVHGLTTAATIWLVAAIGMTVGTGQIGLAVAVTVLAIVCLSAFAPVSNWFERQAAKPVRKKTKKSSRSS